MPIGGLWSNEPVIAKHLDGHLEIFAIGLDGLLYRKHQMGQNQPFVEEWTAFSTDYRDFLYHEEVLFDPITTRISWTIGTGGEMCLFLRTTRGRTVFTRLEPNPVRWADWASVAAVQDGHRATGNPAATSFPVSGSFQVQVVVRSRSSEILHQSGIPRHHEQDRWDIVGSHISDDPVIVSRRAGSTLTTSIFARGVDGALWWNGSRTGPGAGHGIPFAGLRRAHSRIPDGSHLAGQPVSAGPDSVLWRGLDGNLWSSSFSTFGRFGYAVSLRVPSASDPAIVVHGTSQWIFWVAPDGHLMMRRRHGGGGVEAPVSISRTTGVSRFGRPSATTSADGRAEVICVGGDGAMYHFYETAIGSGTFGEGH